MEQYPGDEGRPGSGSTQAETGVRTQHRDTGQREHRIATDPGRPDRRVSARAAPGHYWPGEVAISRRQADEDAQAENHPGLWERKRRAVLRARGVTAVRFPNESA